MQPRKFLDEFVASHRGTRVGRLFGQPAAFAGRRVFARVSGRGLEYRSAGPRGRRGRQPTPEWILVRPSTGRDYLKLVRLLEGAIQAVVTAD